MDAATTTIRRAFTAVLACVLCGALVSVAAAEPAAAEVRNICFPYEGGPSVASWSDSFGDARGGGSRRHAGEDIMSADGQKMRPLVSTVDGTVREIVYDNGSGNRIVIQDDEGWFYVYLHLNNDTPGTDDARANLDQVIAAGLQVGQRVHRCQVIAYVGDSGNAESTSAHLHFEIRQPVSSTRPWAWSSATPINPADSLRGATWIPVFAPPSRPASAELQSAAPTWPWAPFASAAQLVEQESLGFDDRGPGGGRARY